MSTNPPRLFDLVEYYHRHIDELLLLHQEALLIRQLPLAAQLFELFQQSLHSHIEWENQLLLSAHQQLPQKAGDTIRWPTLVYQKEHDKLLAMCDKMARRIAQLTQDSKPISRRKILALLDDQRSLKNVLEHHELREEKGLLLELPQHLTETEQQRIVDTCEQHWRSQEQTLLPPLNLARQQLAQHA